MPALKNPRHERFAQAMHKLGVARHAYVKAGYRARVHSKANSRPVDACASRLLTSASVGKRLQELRAMAEKRHLITIDTLLDRLEEDRKLAHASSQAGAAVQATMAMGKVTGLVVDRKESGKPGEFASLATVAEVIERARRDLGDEAAQAIERLLAAATPELDSEPAPEPTHAPPGRRQ